MCPDAPVRREIAGIPHSQELHHADQIAPLIKGTVLEHYEVIEEDIVGLREKMLEISVKQTAHQKQHERRKRNCTG